MYGERAWIGKRKNRRRRKKKKENSSEGKHDPQNFRKMHRRRGHQGESRQKLGESGDVV